MCTLVWASSTDTPEEGPQRAKTLSTVSLMPTLVNNIRWSPYDINPKGLTHLAPRQLELFANLIFKTSIPIIVYCKILIIYINGWCLVAKAFITARFYQVLSSAYKIWLWWRPLGRNVRHLYNYQYLCRLH